MEYDEPGPDGDDATDSETAPERHTREKSEDFDLAESVTALSR